MTQTHYNTLEVTRTASSEVIRAAYKSLSQRWHPDRNPGNRAEAEARMKEINAAYAALSDPQKRAAYDAASERNAARTQRSPALATPQPREQKDSSGRLPANASAGTTRRWLAISAVMIAMVIMLGPKIGWLPSTIASLFFAALVSLVAGLVRGIGGAFIDGYRGNEEKNRPVVSTFAKSALIGALLASAFNIGFSATDIDRILVNTGFKQAPIAKP